MNINDYICQNINWKNNSYDLFAVHVLILHTTPPPPLPIHRIQKVLIVTSIESVF